MSIDMAWLEKKFFGRKLSDETKELLGEMKESRHRQADRIIATGQKGGNLFIVYAGKVTVEMKDDEGNPTHMGDIGEGNVLGEMSFLNGKEASADVTAKDNTVVYIMPKSLFVKIMESDTDLALDIFEKILSSTSSVVLRLNYKLIPFMKVVKEKVKNIPLIIKLIPVIFTLIYTLAFIYISYKDFSYGE